MTYEVVRGGGLLACAAAVGYSIYRCAERWPIPSIAKLILGTPRHACSVAAGFQVGTTLLGVGKIVLQERERSRLDDALREAIERMLQSQRKRADQAEEAQIIGAESSNKKQEVEALQHEVETLRQELTSLNSEKERLLRECQRLEEAAAPSHEPPKLPLREEHSADLLASIRAGTELKRAPKWRPKVTSDLQDDLVRSLKARLGDLPKCTSQQSVATVQEFSSFDHLIEEIKTRGSVRCQDGSTAECPEAVILFLQAMESRRQEALLVAVNAAIWNDDLSLIIGNIVDSVLNLYAEQQESRGLPPSASVQSTVMPKMPAAPLVSPEPAAMAKRGWGEDGALLLLSGIIGYATYRYFDRIAIPEVIKRVLISPRHACSVAAGLQVGTLLLFGSGVAIEEGERRRLQAVVDEVMVPHFDVEKLGRVKGLEAIRKRWSKRQGEFISLLEEAEQLTKQIVATKATNAGLRLKFDRGSRQRQDQVALESIEAKPIDNLRGHLLTSLENRFPRSESESEVGDRFLSFDDLFQEIAEKGEVKYQDGTFGRCPQAVVNVLRAMEGGDQEALLERANGVVWCESRAWVCGNIIDTILYRLKGGGLPPSRSVANTSDRSLPDHPLV